MSVAFKFSDDEILAFKAYGIKKKLFELSCDIAYQEHGEDFRDHIPYRSAKDIPTEVIMDLVYGDLA